MARWSRSGCRNRRLGGRGACRRSQVEVLEVLAEALAEGRMPERVLHGGLQITELIAAVVAFAAEAIGVHRLLAHQRRNAIGELDLPASAPAESLQMSEDRGRQHVAADYGESRGSDGGFGFLDDAAYAAGVGLVTLDRHDPVFLGIPASDRLDPENARALRLVNSRHLLENGNFAAD